ncbi:MAG TPA: hemerythrin family protein [Candidatus Scalindua sp.]|jgi:hemerythrin|nr:hemerythrin family protein [Candidatus Scalindua sp.]|tara:strand:- start:1085 stop:1471 length:387 start_codon:yes stop_codon:yes gene_type:complete
MNDVYDYKLGIIWQDVQHRRIVEIIKELNSNPEVDYQSIQAQLMFYVEDHFDTEEQYMHRFAYAKTESHIKEHKTFISKCDEITKTCLVDDDLISTMSSYLHDWFLNHILVVDRELAVFLITRGPDNA